jgi:hypothetical protein
LNIMPTNNSFDIEVGKIAKGLEETYRRLIIFKRQKNSPVVISREGKVVEVDPWDMPETTTYERGNGSDKP